MNIELSKPEAEHCIIDLIVSKKEKAAIIFENEQFIAFLDHRPLFPGHTLLAPKQHFRTFYDLPGSMYEPFCQLIQLIGNSIEQAMGAMGSFIAMNNVVSQSIPHLHAHIVPRNKGDGLKGFFWPRTTYQDEEQMLVTQEKIKQHLSELITESIKY